MWRSIACHRGKAAAEGGVAAAGLLHWCSRIPTIRSSFVKHLGSGARSMTDYRKEASTGFANAASYDAHRPSFPPDSVSVLLKGLGVAGKPAADVIDLAAGTGKFTDLLLKRPEHFHVTAVEPHDGMRAILEGKGWKDLAIVNGLSTKMPLQDASVDAVVAAQVSCAETVVCCIALTSRSDSDIPLVG